MRLTTGKGLKTPTQKKPSPRTDRGTLSTRNKQVSRVGQKKGR